MVRETKTMRHTRGFTCWTRFVAMLSCQSERACLRKICSTLFATTKFTDETPWGGLSDRFNTDCRNECGKGCIRQCTPLGSMGGVPLCLQWLDTPHLLN